MRQGLTRKQIVTLVLAGLLSLLLIGLLISYFTRDTGTNQFGDRIKIQNYSSIVKNLSPDMRDSMENYVYIVAAMNHDGTLKGASVDDVLIRDNSSEQSFSEDTNTYDGSFIIDSASLKQSYNVQYSYSKEDDNTNTGSSPVVVSCLPKEQLKYGEFNCTDLVSQSSSPDDVLLQYLPFQNFTFKVTPSETSDGKLTLNVILSIPDIDLSGNADSKKQTVALYKNEVVKWVTSKGVDSDNYIFIYNYDDNGNLVSQ